MIFGFTLLLVIQIWQEWRCPGVLECQSTRHPHTMGKCISISIPISISMPMPMPIFHFPILGSLTKSKPIEPAEAGRRTSNVIEIFIS